MSVHVIITKALNLKTGQTFIFSEQNLTGNITL